MSQLVKTKRQANFKDFKRFGAFKGLFEQKTLYSTRSCVNWALFGMSGPRPHTNLLNKLLYCGTTKIAKFYSSQKINSTSTQGDTIRKYFPVFHIVCLIKIFMASHSMYLLSIVNIDWKEFFNFL
jgi:hypothetical protein